jgi:hypothetical protein
MKIIYQMMAVFGFVALMTSCSPNLTPFTQELYDHTGLSENDLKRVQFYVSRDVVLFRELIQGESKITNGRIKLKNGKQIEEVVIKSGTPGALLFIPKANRFAISFEDGEDSPFLMFGPNPKMDNRYALLAKEWKKYEGKVQYAGKIYQVENDAAFASLLVDIDRIGDTRVRRKFAQGREIN